ncbi:MAG: hypothetical protein OXR66_07275 [Candidatus Woesearchaeota archaeon]|nr:hypothetical protein [Candidatus Woesearchaeota archaeon]
MNWRVLFLLTLLLGAGFIAAEPSGVDILSNTTESPTPQTAASLTTAGGSFTTLILNATTQTLKWKAYVGNISGDVKLEDAANYSIYEWDLTTVTGEVYSSRNTSIDWSSIGCANQGNITAEEGDLNIVTTAVDSINSTFNNTVHTSFYVGPTLIVNSTCRSVATYVNDSAQAITEAADFQEVLLADADSNFVYTTILEEDAQGYNNGAFDFQLIVAEDPTTTSASTYYFYAELG